MIKAKQLLIVSIICLGSVPDFVAQSIIGPDTVCQRETAVYHYDDTSGTTFLWSGQQGYPYPSVADSAIFIFVNSGANGYVNLTVLDSLGATISTHQKNVVVIAPPTPKISSSFEGSCMSQNFETFHFGDSSACKVVCDSSTVYYETEYHAGHTYTWEVFGSISETPNQNEFTVVWDTVPGFGFVRVTETDEYGCSTYQSICIEIVESPSINTQILPSVSICTFESIDFTKSISTTGATRYFWDFGDGNTSQEKNPNYEYTSTGTYDLRFIIENDCGCKDSINVEMQVSSGPSPDVYCISTVCQGEYHVYSIPADSSGNYLWNNITGLNPVTAGQNTSSATIEWQKCDVNGYGIINVYKSGSPSCDQNEYVPIITSIGSYIEGPTTVCANTQHLYTMPPVPGSKFHWTVTGGTFAFGDYISLYTK